MNEQPTVFGYVTITVCGTIYEPTETVRHPGGDTMIVRVCAPAAARLIGYRIAIRDVGLIQAIGRDIVPGAQVMAIGTLVPSQNDGLTILIDARRGHDLQIMGNGPVVRPGGRQQQSSPPQADMLDPRSRPPVETQLGSAERVVPEIPRKVAPGKTPEREPDPARSAGKQPPGTDAPRDGEPKEWAEIPF